MPKNNNLWLFLDSNAKHLTGERQQAYFRAWRRDITMGLFVSIVFILLYFRGQVSLGFIIVATAAVGQMLYTVAKGETYLQLRRKQWQVDKQDRERLLNEMKGVGRGKN